MGCVMDSQQKRWMVIGSVAALIAVWWFFSGGSNPEKELKSASQDRRLLAIEKLEQADTPAAARALEPYTTDEDIQVARRSLFAIGRMGQGGNTQTLVKAMEHPKEQIREAAVVAMAMRGEKMDVVALRDRLARDPSPTVRTAAAAQLGAMRDFASVPLLVAALDSGDEELTNVAMRCLLDIGGREHAGFKPGATPQQRAEAIQSLKRDAMTFKSVNDEYKRYKEVMKR